MNYWLMKSEPADYSIDDLGKEPKKTACWDGVRNYQARNFMRDGMKKGDLAFFYHSNCTPPGIIGVVKIVREAYPDFTAWDKKSFHYDSKSTRQNPRWFMVDVKLVKKFPEIISLAQLKGAPALSSMTITKKGNRLSITPVTKKEWDIILAIS